MTFSVAFSLKYFYGIMANKNSNDSFVFSHFLGKVWEARSKYSQKFDSRFWCIIDNASIHKSDIIKEYVKQNKICLITIPAYSPSLNAVESIIQSIKAKIKKCAGSWKVSRIHSNSLDYRILSTKLIANAANKIASEDLQKYITSQRKEILMVLKHKLNFS